MAPSKKLYLVVSSDDTVLFDGEKSEAEKASSLIDNSYIIGTNKKEYDTVKNNAELLKDFLYKKKGQ